MPSLLDISPVCEKVRIRGQDIDVFGITAESLAGLLYAYEDLRKMFSGMDVDISAEQLLKLGPGVVADIIAAGCGFMGNPEAKQMARTLTVGEQIDILTAIIKITLPGGINSFMGKLEALMAQGRGVSVSAMKVPDTK